MVYERPQYNGKDCDSENLLVSQLIYVMQSISYGRRDFQVENVWKGEEGNCGGKPRRRGTKNGHCR